MDNVRIIESSEERVVFEIENKTGTARLTSYSVYPGIDLVYIDAHIQSFSCRSHPVTHGLFAVNHCEEGRIECNFHNGEFLYMGPGDMSIGWRHHQEYRYSVFFPSSHYHGLSILCSASEAQPVVSRLLEDDCDLTDLCNRFCHESDFGIIMKENKDMQHLFEELYHVPEAIRRRYCQLKVLEIFLFLGTIPPERDKYVYITKRQADIVKAIHFELLKDLTTKKRVEELAEQYHIAPTTLKRCFKSVYGGSIGQHLQELRVAAAMKMLAETEDSVLQIANRVGYANSSKFSMLFQKMTGLLPREYRKIQRK